MNRTECQAFASAPRDPRDALARYTPGADNPWDRRHAAHLLRRAGFGGTLDEIDAAVARGPRVAATEMILTPPDPALVDLDDAIDTVVDNQNPRQLRAWWVLRMVKTQSPFREKLALFLHGHFATGARKVGSLRPMRDQARIFLDMGSGRFEDTTRAVVKGSAMLVYLDATKSERRRPNENLARELMELFTLGRGNYTEDDIREAARALTGWRVDGRGARLYAPSFDESEKTLFGVKGTFGADEVVRACVSQPACAPFISRKLIAFFAMPDPPEPLVKAFAQVLVESEFELGAALEVLLTSRYFYSAECYRALVKSPVEYAVGALRALGGRVSGEEAAEALGEMGQNLFEPPSVKGWDGGRAWIHSATWLARASFAHAATARGGTLDREFDPSSLSASEDANDWVDMIRETFFQGDVAPGTHEILSRMASRMGEGDATRRALLETALMLPEYHCA